MTTQTSTSVFFGSFSLPSRQWRPLSPKAWTCVGGLAIPLWATWPALSLKTREIPAFECLTIIFLVGWCALSCLERPATIDAGSRSWKSWVPAIAFALGDFGSSAFFLMATHHISAAESNLIMYLWPGMVVVFAAMLGIFRLRLRHGIGIIVGFAAVAVLMFGGNLSLSYAGIGFALLAGVSWATYCVFRLKWLAPPGPLLARGTGLAALLCAVMHLLLEPTVLPSIGGAVAATVVGIVPMAFANLAWDEGFRRGDSQLLAVMAYGTPLVSAALLTALGLEPSTWKLFIGACLIVIAGLLSRADTHRA